MPTSPSTEFMRLLEAAGWTQAEAARRLQVTPGAISQICSGRTQPRPSTLNLLRLMVAAETQTGARPVRAKPPGPAWEADLLEPLRRMAPPERDKLLRVLKPIIENWTR